MVPFTEKDAQGCLRDLIIMFLLACVGACALFWLFIRVVIWIVQHVF
jgi:hypothetical protein